VRRRALRRLIVPAALGVALLVVVIVAAGVGQLAIPPTEVVGSLLRAAGIPTGWAPHDPIAESTLWLVRLPRVAMAVAVGAALAVSGAVMQAVFGNPLADSGVVGVSSGAALGAALAIALGLSALSGWGVAALAFAGALAATLLVYLVSRAGGRAEIVTLLLTGIAVNAVGGAGVAFLVFVANRSSREQIVFWQLGSLNGTLWGPTGIVVAVAAAGVATAVLLARRYDLLSLGERDARHLGLDVERLRLVSIVVVALLTGVAVAFCGIIGFVGLVVPHAIRLAIGPRHRPLIAASALGGAALVVLADLLARSALPGADLPIGMVTALVGGPFFFALLLRERRARTWHA
jgi:iron complex transport system permease protein